MKKKTRNIIYASASLVAITALLTSTLIITNRVKPQIELYVVETNTAATTNGGQAILLKAADKNILIDTGSDIYSASLAGTRKLVDDIFDGHIDILILTSLASEYNGGLRSFFETTSFSKPSGLSTVFFPGYITDTDASLYLSENRGQGIFANTNFCTPLETMGGTLAGCSTEIELSDDYSLNILDTTKYLNDRTNVSSDEIDEHNLILDINNKGKDSFHFIIDGGLTESAMFAFNANYTGLYNRVSAWVLSNPDMDIYMKSEYYIGLKPKTTIFTASAFSSSSSRPSLYSRLPVETFRQILNISGKEIYTPLTMGTMKISIDGAGKMKFKGSDIYFYNALNNTQHKPFIYSDLIRNNITYVNVVREVLDIDVSY